MMSSAVRKDNRAAAVPQSILTPNMMSVQDSKPVAPRDLEFDKALIFFREFTVRVSEILYRYET